MNIYLPRNKQKHITYNMYVFGLRHKTLTEEVFISIHIRNIHNSATMRYGKFLSSWYCKLYELRFKFIRSSAHSFLWYFCWSVTMETHLEKRKRIAVCRNGENANDNSFLVCVILWIEMDEKWNIDKKRMVGRIRYRLDMRNLLRRVHLQ